MLSPYLNLSINGKKAIYVSNDYVPLIKLKFGEEAIYSNFLEDINYYSNDEFGDICRLYRRW
jgi:hypothetical protein